MKSNEQKRHEETILREVNLHWMRGPGLDHFFISSFLTALGLSRTPRRADEGPDFGGGRRLGTPPRRVIGGPSARRVFGTRSGTRSGVVSVTLPTRHPPGSLTHPDPPESVTHVHPLFVRVTRRPPHEARRERHERGAEATSSSGGPDLSVPSTCSPFRSGGTTTTAHHPVLGDPPQGPPRLAAPCVGPPGSGGPGGFVSPLWVGSLPWSMATSLEDQPFPLLVVNFQG